MINAISIKIKRFNIDVKLPLVWITYFPFVGWLYPFILKKDDSFAMHHGKQAFVMAVFFTVLPVLFTFVSVFIPTSLRGVRLTTAILIYVSHISYFTLCAFELIKMKEGKIHDAPLFGKYAKMLNV